MHIGKLPGIHIYKGNDWAAEYWDTYGFDFLNRPGSSTTIAWPLEDVTLTALKRALRVAAVRFDEIDDVMVHINKHRPLKNLGGCRCR